MNKKTSNKVTTDFVPSSSIVNTIDFDEVTPDELITIILSDLHYEEVFTKLNELFLGYSESMKRLDVKRDRVIDLMKAVHKEYKKTHSNDFQFPDISSDNDSISNSSESAENGPENTDIYNEEPVTTINQTKAPVKPAAKPAAKPVAKAAAKPVAKPVAKAALKPVAKPVAKAVVKAEEPNQPEAAKPIVKPKRVVKKPVK